MAANFLRNAALLALCVIPAAAYLAAIRRVVNSSGRRQSTDLIFGFFAGYILILAVLTLAPAPFSLSNGGSGINLVPVVRSLRCFVPNPGQPSTTLFCVRIISGNVLLFVPMGLLMPLLSPKFSSLRLVFLTALVASISIEALQAVGSMLGNGRWSDVDDVILNGAGALLGYVLAGLLAQSGRSL